MQLAYLLCLLSTLCLLHSLVLGGGLHGALVDCGNLSTQPVTTEELITGSEKYCPPLLAIVRKRKWHREGTACITTGEGEYYIRRLTMSQLPMDNATPHLGNDKSEAHFR